MVILEAIMDSFLQEVGGRVKEARVRKHLSQAQLAEMLGLSSRYISNLETGKQNMSITALAKISDVLEVSADWILRNNTRDALEITADELRDLLADCSPAERMGIMRVAQETKKALKSKNHES